MTNSVVRVLAAERSPLALLANPLANKVYAANNQSSSVTVFHDSVHVGIEETPSADGRAVRQGPLGPTANSATVVRGVLFLPVAGGRKPQAESWLLDVGGRQVMSLRPGANDVSRLSPGVYFVRAIGCEPSDVGCHKVVLTE